MGLFRPFSRLKRISWAGTSALMGMCFRKREPNASSLLMWLFKLGLQIVAPLIIHPCICSARVTINIEKWGTLKHYPACPYCCLWLSLVVSKSQPSVVLTHRFLHRLIKTFDWKTWAQSKSNNHELGHTFAACVDVFKAVHHVRLRPGCAPGPKLTSLNQSNKGEAEGSFRGGQAGGDSREGAEHVTNQTGAPRPASGASLWNNQTAIHWPSHFAFNSVLQWGRKFTHTLKAALWPWENKKNRSLKFAHISQRHRLPVRPEWPGHVTTVCVQVNQCPAGLVVGHVWSVCFVSCFRWLWQGHPRGRTHEDS